MTATGLAPARRGFTLVEMVVVITLLGVLAAVGAQVIGRFLGLFSMGREQAQVLAESQRVLQRMSDEVRMALPNSVRVTQAGATVAIEFVPLRGVVRYRARLAAQGDPGDALDIDDPLDDRFDVLGPLPSLASDSQLVIHNLGIDDADVYSGGNRRGGLALDTAARKLSFTPAGLFPMPSPTARAAVVDPPVSFICEPAADGSGRLWRVSGYGIAAIQPADMLQPPLSGAQRALLAVGVTACAASYDANQENQGLLAVRLSLLAGQTPAELQQHIAVETTP